MTFIIIVHTVYIQTRCVRSFATDAYVLTNAHSYRQQQDSWKKQAGHLTLLTNSKCNLAIRKNHSSGEVSLNLTGIFRSSLFRLAKRCKQSVGVLERQR